MLQNSTTIKEFNIILENIFNIFNQPKKNERFENSKKYIERTISNRKEKFDITFATTPKDRERSKMFSKFKNANTKETKRVTKESYMANSPWTLYYENMIKGFKDVHLIEHKLEESLKINIFYRPDMFKIISNLLYLTPAWSGTFIALHFDANKGYCFIVIKFHKEYLGSGWTKKNMVVFILIQILFLAF